MQRLLPLAAALALVLGSSGFMRPAPAAAATPFTDIAGSQFVGDIDWAYNNDITRGCTTTKFCPDSVVTRDQMASFLDRMFGFPATTQDFFADDVGNLHEGAINRLAAAGVTGGCATGKYCPKANVTREQMASFIARAAKLGVGAGRNYFYDDNGRPHEPNIDMLAAAGIGSGCGTYRFCPAASVTRGQMTAFLHRIIAPKTPPPYPAPPPPTTAPSPTPPPSRNCDAAYPTVCIPSPPPDLDCGDIPYRRFTVRAPDPHGFDGDHDGIGCETG